jgi:hypothetical protein
MNLIAVREPIEGIDMDKGIFTIQGFEYIFENIISVILALAGIVLFILLIMGGIKLITAGGEPPKIQEAKGTLTFAIAGIILIALSFLILRIISVITGVDVTQLVFLKSTH